MTMNRRNITLAALAIAVALAGGCDTRHGSTKAPKPPSKDQQFKDKCRLRGGTPVISRRNGESQYNCVPPIGGWQ